MNVLSLTEVLGDLEARTRSETTTVVSANDEEESYREGLAKLLNAYGLELIKLCEDVR